MLALARWFLLRGSAALVFASLLSLSCSPDSSTGPPEQPTTGSLRVSVQTTGEDIDADGYTLNVTGLGNRSVPATGSTLFEEVSPGGYTVTISGVAANCNVSSGSVREVAVAAGSTATVSFAVGCQALVGTIVVTTATTGEDIDADGYSVTIDGATTQTVGSSGSISFAGVAEGTHSVQLNGIADNCSVSGSNPRDVSVAAGGSAQTTFNVVCSSLLGNLTVTTVTSGEAYDPDGYSLEVDGTLAQAIGVNDTVRFVDLTAGRHSVELVGMASNCTVSGVNPRAANVPVGGSVTVAFSVVCDPTTGSLEVSVHTIGSDLDEDGYQIVVDGTASQSAASNDTIVFGGLGPGSHSVELTGIADNCMVEGVNPLVVTVAAGATTIVGLEVSCSSADGELRVGATTSGTNLDPDGYVVVIDGGARSTRIGVNGETGFAGLSAGDHQVELQDVADNCQPFGDNPRVVRVVGGQSVTATFSVECSSTVGTIRVRANTTGVDIDSNGYVAEIDGGFRTTRIGPNDETGFGNLLPGDHLVSLTDVASNCSVLGQNPRTVSLAAGATELVTFGVECVALNPTITSVTPGSGGYAQTVTITGFNLAAEGLVTRVFSDGEGLGSFTIISETEIRAQMGTYDVAGAHLITVEVGGIASNGVVWTQTNSCDANDLTWTPGPPLYGPVVEASIPLRCVGTATDADNSNAWFVGKVSEDALLGGTSLSVHYAPMWGPPLKDIDWLYCGDAGVNPADPFADCVFEIDQPPATTHLDLGVGDHVFVMDDYASYVYGDATEQDYTIVVTID